MFDWETVEPAEYQHDDTPHIVALTTRSYITANGHAYTHTAAATFLTLAKAVQTVAATIANSAALGIEVSGFKAYRPYPLQAVWKPDSPGEAFKLWLKQPLFIDAAAYSAAIEHAGLSAQLTEALHFEQLAEGTEIQIAKRGEAGAQAQALQQLTEAVQAAGYRPLTPSVYREVYLGGLPIKATTPVLFRIALDPTVGPPHATVHN